VLDDEDISTHLQLKLSERVKDGKYIVSADVCDIVASKDMQDIFKSAGICKPSISERTARRWLNRLSWRYKRKQNGMYIDGHERPDVVADRVAFCKRWADYEKRFVKFDNEGNELPRPQGFSVPGKPFRLILVTHDESTFYQNDQRRLHWQHTGTRAAPHPKGEGQSIMVSDFLTLEWGRLKDEKEEARVLFKAGKNRDGWFDAEDLHEQTHHAIDIFEGLTNGFAQGLFMFDNAPSHQKRAADALSARKMVKFPREGWTHNGSGVRMRRGYFGKDKTPQDFYFPDDHPTMPGWFKGMETIIRER
ncbi:hypothetical protein EV715DRAFT_171758, partial [Schizophyllum commune]